jgi:hypothetical protein
MRKDVGVRENYGCGEDDDKGKDENYSIPT